MGLLQPLTLVDKHIRSKTDVDKPSITTTRSEPYLTGLRGLIAISSLVWIFFSTFIPGIVYPHVDAPGYQKAIRDIFSSLLWNESLIGAFFVILSMRTICVTFLRNPDTQTYGGTLLRRIFRMVILLGVGSGLTTMIVSLVGPQLVDEFRLLKPNQAITTPTKAPTGGAAINSIFNLFWLTDGFFTQAANTFWPSATLWVSAVNYYQGWTVYILMVFLPYTRAKWHAQGLGLFALGSFWYASWGWYSATGLLLADIAHNTVLSGLLKNGFKIKENLHIPTFVGATFLTMIGVALKYMVTIIPKFENSMLILHPFLDLSEQTSKKQYIAQGPYPRVDDWCVVVGVLLLVETLPKLKQALSFRPLVWIGERAFSLFIAQSILFWTLGMKLWLYVHVIKGHNDAASNMMALAACFPLICIFTEVFHRLVDMPSRWGAARIHLWLLE